MKNKIKKLLYLSIVILTVGCDFLDEDPESIINSANFYQTESDAIAATNAIYDYMTVGTAGIFDEEFGGIFFNDFWVFKDILSDNCFETITSAEYKDLSEFKFTASNIRIELYWEDLYKTINAANIVIDKVPEIDMDDLKKNHLVSEARFIRALMYFEAVRLFGDVPLFLHETSSIEEATIARTDKMEVYSAIIDDLEFSSSNLSNGYRVGNGRPVPLACKALLAKVYLEMGEYQLSANHAEEVIVSGEFMLWPDFANIFKIENMNSGEIIFAANYSGTQSQGFKPNQYHVRLLPTEIYDPIRNEGPQNAWGWERPTDELYNSFTPLDRRRDVTFIKSFRYSDGSTINFDSHIGKFWDQEVEPEGNNTDSDVIYLRYADVLLMYAEALNETGNTPQAITLINQIRSIHGLMPPITVTSQADVKTQIIHERTMELTLESVRFFDLRRWGMLDQAMQDAGRSSFNSATHAYLPVPLSEINANPNID